MVNFSGKIINKLSIKIDLIISRLFAYTEWVMYRKQSVCIFELKIQT